jgi:hypothetical protein
MSIPEAILVVYGELPKAIAATDFHQLFAIKFIRISICAYFG